MTDQSRAVSCRELMGTNCFICGAECGTLEELRLHRETEHPDEEPVQAREFPCWNCLRPSRRNLRGQVCPQCQFMGAGREQYAAFENLANQEAYLEYLGDPAGYLEYRTEYGYGDLEESP